MADITSFRDVIELWSSREEMAADLRAIDPEANASAVSKWWQRDSIPSEWWAAVLGAERARGSLLTASLLTALAAREPVEARL